MFYHINGVVTDIEPNLVVLECGGVGYALNASLNTISGVKLGERAKLYAYEYIREDAHDLFGFLTKGEKRCFEMLIGISGVGPKAAISILSSNTPESLALAVLNGDVKALTCAPGIGKKIAQRIVLELRDKMSKSQLETASPAAAAFGRSSAPSSSVYCYGDTPDGFCCCGRRTVAAVVFARCVFPRVFLNYGFYHCCW